MSYSKAFEELDKTQHDRVSFDCGEDELNDFIQTKASKHMLAGISRTFVLPADSPLPNGKRPICAFYSVTPSSIVRENLPRALAKKTTSLPDPGISYRSIGCPSGSERARLRKDNTRQGLRILVEYKCANAGICCSC